MLGVCLCYDVPMILRTPLGCQLTPAGSLTEELFRFYSELLHNVELPMRENPISQLKRLHEEERRLLELLELPQHSVQRRTYLEDLLHLVRAEITELLARNIDAAGTA
jgi:hypothetical protein